MERSVEREVTERERSGERSSGVSGVYILGASGVAIIAAGGTDLYCHSEYHP